MENLFTIGILLNVIDKATRPITQISRAMKELEERTEKTTSRFEKLKNKLSDVGSSLENFARTAISLGAFTTITSAFSELEDASTILKSTFMEAGGKIPEVFYAVDREAKKLGTELPGTTADFYQLAASMKQLGVSGEVLAKGGLRAAAYLAVALRIPYQKAGEAVAKFSQALGIAGKDLVQFMDVVQRLGHLGVEVGQMSYAFSKLAGTIRLAGWGGLETAKKLAPLVGRLIQLGRQGEEVGTNLAAMFDAMMKTEKVEKVNRILREYGVELQFIDERTGKLKGPELLIAELSKVGELVKRGVISRAEALSLFSQLFGEGAAAEFAVTFALEGVEGYNRMVERMKRQADLQRRVALATSTLRNVWEAFLGTMQNVYAAVGETIAPPLKKIALFLNELAGSAEEFFKKHKTLGGIIAWSIAIFTAASMALLALGTAIALLRTPVSIAVSALKLLRFHLLLTRAATLAFSLALRASPISWIALAIAVAGYLIYKNWDRVKGLWDALKTKLSMFSSWLSSNWKKALSVFLWVNPITAPIMALKKLINFLKSIDLSEAGKKIILTLTKGIMSAAFAPVKSVQGIVQKIRNLLPFSPAKEGPLRDLAKTGLKLVQTIAAGITPTPLVSALTKAFSATLLKPATPTPTTISTGATSTVINVYLGGITINGKAEPKDIEQITTNIETLIRRAMERIEKDRWRRQL